MGAGSGKKLFGHGWARAWFGGPRYRQTRPRLNSRRPKQWRSVSSSPTATKNATRKVPPLSFSSTGATRFECLDAPRRLTSSAKVISLAPWSGPLKQRINLAQGMEVAALPCYLLTYPGKVGRYLTTLFSKRLQTSTMPMVSLRLHEHTARSVSSVYLRATGMQPPRDRSTRESCRVGRRSIE